MSPSAGKGSRTRMARACLCLTSSREKPFRQASPARTKNFSKRNWKALLRPRPIGSSRAVRTSDVAAGGVTNHPITDANRALNGGESKQRCGELEACEKRRQRHYIATRTHTKPGNTHHRTLDT